jgi:hypothetical protein
VRRPEEQSGTFVEEEARLTAARSHSNLVQQGICWDRMRQKTSVAGNLVGPKMADLFRGQDHPQLRPAAMDVPAQFNTACWTGDVSQENVYIILRFQGCLIHPH